MNLQDLTPEDVANIVNALRVCSPSGGSSSPYRTMQKVCQQTNTQPDVMKSMRFTLIVLEEIKEGV